MSPIKLLAFAAILSFLPLEAVGQAAWKPERNVEFVIGSNPGTGTDVVARIIQRIWQETKTLNVSSSVANKAGGGGAVSWAYLSQRANDPHYLLVTSYNIVTGHITGRSRLTYSDFTPIALLMSEYIAYSVRADSALKSASDLVGILKKDPQALAIGLSAALGGANHIALALFMKAGQVDYTKMRIVVFSSGRESITALMGGHVDFVVASGSAIAPQVVTGQVRPLAFAAPKRIGGAFASVPTLSEIGYPVTADNWRIVIAANGLTPAQTAFWDMAFRTLASSEEWNKELDKRNLSNNYLNSVDTMKFLQSQYAEVRTILTELGLARPPKE
jgi:putative tricarboxylic transport membrane protein